MSDIDTAVSFREFLEDNRNESSEHRKLADAARLLPVELSDDLMYAILSNQFPLSCESAWLEYEAAP